MSLQTAELSVDLLEQVLSRLGLADRPAPTLDGLQTLYAAWCRKVPFDNVRKLIHLHSHAPGPLPGDDPAEFLAAWSQAGAQFDRTSEQTGREFSMTDMVAEFLTATLGRAASAAQVETFVTTYLREWNAGVRQIPGLTAMVAGLAAQYRLAVVSNTQRAGLVPAHLEAMGLLPYLDAVITSIDVGWRKPHPRIYAKALAEAGVEAGAALFVGDTWGPDVEGPLAAGIPAVYLRRVGHWPDGTCPLEDPTTGAVPVLPDLTGLLDLVDDAAVPSVHDEHA